MADVKTTALAALTAPVDADLAMVVDVSDTTMAGSGTNKGIRLDEAREYFVGVVPGLATGSGAATANTSAIQATLDAAESAGGGTVVIPVGTWQINATLNIGSRVVLRGLGWGSVLFFANGTSTNASPKSMILAKSATNYVGIADLYLDGNKANQTDSTNKVSHGVDFGRATTEGSGAPVYDGGMWCRNVMVYGCQGTGFKVNGDATTMRVHNCYAYHNDTHGFFGKTDCIFTDSVAGNNGNIGFYWYAGTSIVASGLKSFGNTNSDFAVENSNTVMMNACQSEDFTLAGFYLTACSHVSLTGCQAYRSKGADASRSGFFLVDDGGGNLCKHVMMRGCSVLGGGTGGVQYALTTQNLGTGIDVELHTETLLAGNRNHVTGASAGRFIFNAAYPERLAVALSDETTTITTGTAKVTMRMPYAMTLTEVRASVNTVSSSGVVTVDINEAGTTILSTKLTIDASEKTSTTAATPAVISDTALADDAEITFDIDTAGTGAKGLKCWLIGTVA